MRDLIIRGRLLLVCLLILLVVGALMAQTDIAVKDDWYFRSDDKKARIYVYEIGDGEPFVVLHGGFGAEHSYLLDAVKGLESKFHFVFYDQRGSLRSPTNAKNISIHKHIDDLETLRKALGLEKLNIFGHSNGTLLAMR